MSTDYAAELIQRTEQSPREVLARAFFLVCASISVLTTIGIVVVLVRESATFFAETAPLVGFSGPTVPIVEFLTGTVWSPVSTQDFGVIPLVVDTLIIVVGSAAIALPLGLATAIYLSEYASPEVRSYLKPALEILAGVPTVIYGFFALIYITPALGTIFPDITFFNALSASVVVGIMIIPMVSSISEDAMSAVPDELREAGYGMGATKFDVSVGVVVPASISGIASSYILALSRAIGETMAVALAAGSTPNMPAGELASMTLPLIGDVPAPLPQVYLEPILPMTGAMVQLLTGDITGGGVAYRSLFAIGVTLFVITLAMNVVSDLIARRYREEYR
jgi:phosphate transport system permease protein